MASILKRPVGSTKGILVVTDVEYRDLVLAHPAMRASLAALRERWLLLVHANSAIRQSYDHDSLVDAFIAGPGDITSTDSTPLPQIMMDCSNFSPGFFATPPATEKFWDVLFISRNQQFKSLEDLFGIVRTIFDMAPLRVLAIIAHSNVAEIQTSEPLRLYAKMFTTEERKLFTLLTPWVDYPFCFDLPTLAQFYHRARVFLHTAAQERHPRVVGYAWAAGLPVVARPSAAALLPSEMAQPPGLFAFDTVTVAAAQVRCALQASSLPASYTHFHLAPFQIDRFKQEIRAVYARRGENYTDDAWELDDLDIRLARHHGLDAGVNSYKTSLHQLADQLAGPLGIVTGPRIEEVLLDASLSNNVHTQSIDRATPVDAKGLRHMLRAMLWPRK